MTYNQYPAERSSSDGRTLDWPSRVVGSSLTAGGLTVSSSKTRQSLISTGSTWARKNRSDMTEQMLTRT